jgi:hypothetical protein
LNSTVTKSGSELDSTNNTHSRTILTGAQIADLGLRLDTSLVVNVTNTPQFDVTVRPTNMGPSGRGNSVLTYDLRGVVPVTIPSQCNSTSGSLVCQLASSTPSFTIKLRAVTLGSNLSTATISSSVPDPVPGNNTVRILSLLEDSTSITTAQVPMDSWWVLLVFALFIFIFGSWKYKTIGR